MDSSSTHLKCAANHESNRRKVCAGCGHKCKESKKGWPLITDTLAKDIKLVLNESFNLEDDHFPLSLCINCKVAISNYKKKGNGKIPKMPNFQEMILPKKTRSDIVCFCYICLTGSNVGRPLKFVGGPGERKQEIFITAANGLYGAQSSRPDLSPPGSSSEKQKRASSLTICNRCRQVIGKGISHPQNCKVASSSVNIYQQVKELPERQQEQVATQIIYEKAALDSSNTKQLKDIKLTLSTKGKKANICLNPKKHKSIFFPEESMANLQTATGESNLGMKKICHFIRVHAGRKALPSYMREKMTALGKSLEDLYHLTWLDLDVGQGKTEKRPVFYGDAQEIVGKVCEARDIHGPCIVKLMADSGQGSFKISLAIFPEPSDPDSSDEASAKKARTTYAQGGSVGGDLSLNGVKRLIMLVHVPDIKETWANCKALWDLAGINNVSYLFVADFKLTLTVLGLQTASASYPCPYCFISLKQLRGAEEAQDNSESLDPLDPMCFRERTFGDLKSDHQRHLDLGEKNGKLSNSTVNPSILEEEDSVRVIDKVPLPELHLLLGVVNHLFWDKGGLIELLGRDKAMSWAIKFNVVSVGYHGEVFEGPACRKLLKNADFLLSPEYLEGIHDPISLIPLATTLQSLNKLVEACFGTEMIKDNVSMLLENFTRNYMALESSITLKVHVLMSHLIPGLANLGGKGMGLTSEQAGESIHHEFERYFWSRRKIKLSTNPNYGINWLNANLEFSSKHM